MKNNIAIVIDGNSLSYRAYYATLKQLEYFKNSDRQPTNAIKLMLLMSLKILNEHDPQYAVIAFDAGRKTFRDDVYDKYKAGRHATPKELLSQLPLIQQVLEYSGFCICAHSGIEADDVIGSFVNLANRNKINTFVYTSDKDMLQLVNENTIVYQPKKGVSEMMVYNNKNFSDLYHGLNPSQVIDFKAIVGDPSDNLPGVKGIGKTIGVKLIQKYQTLEKIYKNLSDLSPNHQKLFTDSKEMAFKCKTLATIKCDFFDDKKITDFLRKPMNDKKVLEFLQKYRINNLENEIYKATKSLFS